MPARALPLLTGDTAGTRQAGMVVRPASFLRWPLQVAAISEFVALAVLALGALLRPMSGLLGRADAWPLESDAWWYVSIAGRGYHAAPLADAPGLPGLHDFAFFPAWPALIRALSPTATNVLAPTIAALVAGLGLWLVAAVLWYRFLRRRAGRRAARRTLLLTAWAPPALVVACGYSEPLYLVLLVAWFAIAGISTVGPGSAHPARLARVSGIGRWLGRPGHGRLVLLFAFGVALGLTRASALALLPAALLLPVDRRTRVVALAGPLVGLGAWVGAVGALTGRLDGFASGIPAWLAVTGQPRGLWGWLEASDFTLLDLPAWVPLALPALVGLAAIAAWRHGARAEAAYAAASLLLALGGGVITSAERYVWPALLLVGPSLLGHLGKRTFRFVLATSIGLWVLWALTLVALARNP